MAGSTHRAIALVTGMGVGMTFCGHAMGAWYVGLGGGISELSPDTAGSPFTLEDKQSQAVTAYVGLDINDWLAAEAAFTDLGSADLSGNQEIKYTAASIGGIAYVLLNRGIDARQSGLAGYVRLGVNSISNESQVALDEADSTSVWLGAGVQYPISERFGLRAEVTSYDGDANVAMASIYWRSRGDRDRRGAIMPDSGRLEPSTQSSNNGLQGQGVDEVEAFEGYGNDGNRLPGAGGGISSTPDLGTEIIKPDTAGISSMTDFASAAECDVPAPGEPTDSAGCALFTGIIDGVEFEMGSAVLKPNSEFRLESLARSLNAYPALVIEIQAHTEAYPEQGRAMQISRERVVAVARFLAGQGVNVKRVRARAFGSAQPRFEGNSTEIRKLNNRIALRVL